MSTEVDAIPAALPPGILDANGAVPAVRSGALMAQVGPEMGK
jgi:hypothetical protein